MTTIKTWEERLAYPHSNSREQTEAAMQAEITELRAAVKSKDVLLRDALGVVNATYADTYDAEHEGRVASGITKELK